MSVTEKTAGKTTVRLDALARIAKAVKRIREQPEAAHGDGCRLSAVTLIR